MSALLTPLPVWLQDSATEMVYGRKIFILNVLLIVLSVSTVVFLFRYGPGQRVFLEDPVLRILSEPRDNVAAWRETGIYGRVLFHFDRRMHAEYDPERPDTDNENYIYVGVLENFVREVYHVIPDRSWPEVSEHLNQNPDASPYGPGFRISMEGTPLFIIRARDIPSMDERVLVHINGNYWLEEDWPQVLDVFTHGVLRTDVVTVSGMISDNQVRMLWNAIDPPKS